jgi:regulatory protein
MRPALSLYSRAVGYLARREHSRLELSKKLRPHADTAEEVEAVLARLIEAKLLSDERFAESLAHRRADRYGSARLGMELKQQGVAEDIVARTLAGARSDELARARAIFERRFGEPAKEANVRAKQAAFLMRRGFASGIVAQVLRGLPED